MDNASRLSCCGISRFLQSIPSRGGRKIPFFIDASYRLLSELLMGLEPMTSSLPRKCSTTELQQPFRAGEGNRTLVFSLEGCCSTIELHPLDVKLATNHVSDRHPVGPLILSAFQQIQPGFDLIFDLILDMKWGLQDLNLCRRSQRIYSPPPLTTRANPLQNRFAVCHRQLGARLFFLD